jgi:hypothetical protein
MRSVSKSCDVSSKGALRTCLDGREDGDSGSIPAAFRRLEWGRAHLARLGRPPTSARLRDGVAPD